MIQWLHEKNTRVTLTNMGTGRPPIDFLDDALFFEQLCGQKLRAHASPRATTRPPLKIAHERSHAWLQQDLLPWLSDEAQPQHSLLSLIISLNPDLIRAPITCIDYVITHELVQLIHPHHGPAFYDLLETLMPDWRSRKERLERTLS
jgi:YgjP-like, metallopeptidase domain